MSDKEPTTAVQRSALLVLMAEGIEVPNSFLTNVRKLDLKAVYRQKLVDDDLIKVRKQGPRIFLELTDDGWHWCEGQFKDGIETPFGAGHGSAAAYAIMASIARALKKKTPPRTLGDFFSPLVDHTPVEPRNEAPLHDTTVVDVEIEIRKAYTQLTPGQGEWVQLASLRSSLVNVSKSDVDQALLTMSTMKDVTVAPESNQKALSDAQIAAAVRIGNQNKHLIAIH